MTEDQFCTGCIGRGTGGRCCVCGGTIPEDLRLTPDAPSEIPPGAPEGHQFLEWLTIQNEARRRARTGR